jgi:hypothetical protein
MLFALVPGRLPGTTSTTNPLLLPEASESAADAVANVRRTRGVDHLDRL